jgi:hypothetical protein
MTRIHGAPPFRLVVKKLSFGGLGKSRAAVQPEASGKEEIQPPLANSLMAGKAKACPS